jgi:NADH-quinone oxidoreductase subunit M
VVAIIYGALVAWVQQDIKKLVAYSSVSHMGFCVLGMAALNFEGVYGAILYMINHGLSTGAMFLCVGMIYERYHTRDINELSGLAKKMPKLAFFFILFTLSSVALPGLNGFASEFLTILGAFKSRHLGSDVSPNLGIVYGSLAALGIILGAVYMLHMAARVIWGPLKTPGAHDEHGHEAAAAPAADEHALPPDLNAREVGLLIPLALAVIVLGVIPGKLMDTFYHPVSSLLGAVDGERAPNPYTVADATAGAK